jgi:PadR family transcriptional regulator, regulatory protein PadR
VKDDRYARTLLDGWEEVYKKGQLTLWVMLALKDGPKHMAAIREFITSGTNGVLTVDDQSLYRALRRYHDAEMTDFESAPGNGPDRKVYRLSPLGEDVLRRFLRRNVVESLYRPPVRALIERTSR